MRAKKSIETAWLPEPLPIERTKDGNRHMHNGQPAFFIMEREAGEDMLRADQRVVCCDCGLDHLMSYEVFRTPKGRYVLAVRAYRVSTDTAKDRAAGRKRGRRCR
jgi:hypothetical protein